MFSHGVRFMCLCDIADKEKILGGTHFLFMLANLASVLSDMIWLHTDTHTMNTRSADGQWTRNDVCVCVCFCYF